MNIFLFKGDFFYFAMAFANLIMKLSQPVIDRSRIATLLLAMFIVSLSCKEHKARDIDLKAVLKVYPLDFLDLSSNFAKDSGGRINTARKIPMQLIKKFMPAEFDTSFNTSANPWLVVENRYGYFFMVKVYCISGGDCASYQLLAFDKDGKFVKTQEIGILTAEEDDRTDFKYRVTSDTTLIAHQIERNLAKDEETRSPEILVKLSF